MCVLESAGNSSKSTVPPSSKVQSSMKYAYKHLDKWLPDVLDDVDLDSLLCEMHSACSSQDSLIKRSLPELEKTSPTQTPVPLEDYRNRAQSVTSSSSHSWTDLSSSRNLNCHTNRAYDADSVSDEMRERSRSFNGYEPHTRSSQHRLNVHRYLAAKRREGCEGSSGKPSPPLSSKYNGPKAMSLPIRHSAPDPFPELSNSPISPPASHILMDSSNSSPAGGSPLMRPNVGTPESQQCLLRCDDSQEDVSVQETFGLAQNIVKTMLNFYNDEQTSRSVLVDDEMTCGEVCQNLVLRNHAQPDRNWAVVEYLDRFGIERSLEDHESVLLVYRSWGHTEPNKLFFRKDFKKYEFFHNPLQFFPAKMVELPSGEEEAHSWLSNEEERRKQILLKCLSADSREPSQIHGNLQMKEGKKSWKKYYFFVKDSALYYCVKGNSKNSKNTVLFCQLNDVNLYTANNAKKNLGAPNNFCFVLKPTYSVTDPKELKCLCSEDEQSRTCWLTGLRIAKYGQLVKENYKQALKRESNVISDPKKKESTSEGKAGKVRVPMDFTGNKGRVVDDPNEAKVVAIAEAHHWRKKKQLRPSRSPMSQSPTAPPITSFLSESFVLPTHGIASGVHMTQPWFHSGISREEAVSLILGHGEVDGVYLVRESLTIPGAYVLSVAHNHRVMHCQILKYNGADSMTYFSMDGGFTRFTDLIQLVDFYTINPAGLPCSLTHYVSKLV